MKLRTALAFASVSLMALSTPAFAQDAPSQDEAAPEDIVVTGTLLRGTAPVGSQSISVGQQKLQEIGAISSNELLASVPQVSNYFNNVPLADLNIAVNQIQVSRPNIRNLAAPNSASSPTLILVDGHRIAGVGVNQSSVDPDLIPTAAIERVDVVTEGGSATYGADAVAGVINFVTRRRFDGLKVDASYGFADDYWQWAASAIAGKDWGSGSAYVAYSYTKNSALFGRDRDFIRNLDYTSATYVGRDLTCANPNLGLNTVIVNFNATIASVNYAAPGFAANTFNRCDNGENATRVPAAERHGALFALNQEVGERTTIDFRAYYGQRKTRGTSELTGTVNVSPANPFAASALPPGLVLGTIPGLVILGSPVANRAVVNFSFSPALGLNAGYSNTGLKEWGARAEIKHDLGDDWQLRALANWSESDSTFNLNRPNATRLTAAGSATTPTTAINPFNIAQTNRALLLDIVDNELTGQVKDSLIQLRVIADGRLFTMPGGDVRVALGYEYMHDNLKKRVGNDVRVGTLRSVAYTPYKRDVHSVFGELQLPIIGADNSSSGLQSLVLSASGRYDHYSDFGDTFNPKIGLTFEPVAGVRIRGNWGTSFTAPNPLDQLGALNNTISAFPFVPFPRPGDTVPAGAWAIAIQGSQPGLKPQTADTWSVGLDLEPTQGLRLSGSYYDVKFTDILGTPTPSSAIFADFPGNVQASVSGLTPTQLRAFAGLVPGGSAVVEPLIAGGVLVYQTVDFRVGNFGIVKVKGLDFSANYTRDTGFGSVDFAVNGNVQLSRKAQRSPTAATVDELRVDRSKFSLQAIAGVNVDTFRAQVTWNHSGGYNIDPTNSVPVQTRVKAFNTVNLFFKYDVPGESMLLKDLSLTLNVNNVFDQDPPVLLRNNPNEAGYANGFTLGRLIQFGISKKF